jgi:hypothetical protein
MIKSFCIYTISTGSYLCTIRSFDLKIVCKKLLYRLRSHIKLHLQKAFVPPKRNKKNVQRNKKRTETQKTHQETKNAQKQKSTMQYRIKIIRSRLFIGKHVLAHKNLQLCFCNITFDWFCLLRTYFYKNNKDHKVNFYSMIRYKKFVIIIFL